MTSAAPSSHPTQGYAKHRVEALTDGIFAVAMTLLVIELKLPDHATVHTQEALLRAVLILIPRFIAWIISFFVLAIFWFGHHRLFNPLRAVDGRLIWLGVGFLTFVSLMPFSSALAGEYALAMFSQVFYSANMIMLSAFALMQSRYVYRHPELWGAPVSPGQYRGARFRTGGLIGVALVAIAMASLIPGAGNVAFLLMIPISIISRRIESRSPAASPTHIPVPVSE